MSKKTRICILIAVSLLFITGLSYHGLSVSGNQVETETPAASDHEFIRCLPDMKVLFQPGKPITTKVDLEGMYKEIDDFGEAGPKVELIDDGSKDVVVPTLKGEKLLLEWKALGKSKITFQITNQETGVAFYDRVQLEAWTPNISAIIFGVLGGLGIFLLGMKFMSDGLQIVAGPSLRRMIAVVTNNRFTAVLVGLTVTSIIQSSSVTTVMVVGFVNSQIMTLSQAIGVIMGANIGTTVTAWIMSLDLGKYGLPILGGAALFYMFGRAERTRYIAMAIMGLGFVFFGLELMQKGFSPLRDLPAFTAWMESFSADTYGGILLCVAVGCMLTLIVQSSSATLGITLSLAAIGAIQFETAAALVLGENIGTTITAALASIGATINARRAAYFHILFNVFGVFWATLVFRIAFMPIVTSIVGIDPATGIIRDPKVGIAMTHTLFNVTNTLIFLPFTVIIAKMLVKYLPDKKEKTEGYQYLSLLGKGAHDPPVIAVEHSRYGVIRMGDDCTKLIDMITTILQSDNPDKETIDAAFYLEEQLDTFQDEIIGFTSSLLSGNISYDISEIAHQQLRMADEIESISDYLIVILKSDLKMRQDELQLPPEQKEEIMQLHTGFKTYFEQIMKYYSDRDLENPELLTEAYAMGRSFTLKAKEMRNDFIKQLSQEKYNPNVVIAFNTQLSAYRRVREHAQNIAETMAGIK